MMLGLACGTDYEQFYAGKNYISVRIFDNNNKKINSCGNIMDNLAKED